MSINRIWLAILIDTHTCALSNLRQRFNSRLTKVTNGSDVYHYIPHSSLLKLKLLSFGV